MTDTHTTTHIPDEAVQAMPKRVFLGCADDDNEHAAWTEPDEGGTEYIRADLTAAYLSCVVSKPEHSLDTKIADYVIDFLVSHQMLDESDEYSLQDIMAALHDNYTPTKPVDVAAVREDAEQLIRNRFDTYTAKNGKRISIEGDDGEKCWIASFEDMHDLENALRTLSAEPVQGEQWRPIETAPKDGTPFVAVGSKYEEAQAHITRRVGYQEGSIGHAQGNTDTWWEYTERNFCFKWKPTHWMPLPDAPTTETGK